MDKSLEHAQNHPVSEVYEPNISEWQNIKDQVILLEQEAFEGNAFSPQELETDFLNSKNTIVVLKEGDVVIGFTYARTLDEADEPGRESEVNETVYIWDTVIQKDYRGQHLVGEMMSTLEVELKRKGYSYMERVAATANGYADGVAKYYKDRIVASEPRQTKYGSQVFFRIKL